MLFTFSCKEKSKQETIILNLEKKFTNNWSDPLYHTQQKINEEEYNDLQLETLKFVPAFANSDFIADTLLLDTLGQKIIALRIINSGEILEYLLTYKDNKLVDNLLVSYEDNVEYYEQISSILKNDSIITSIIRWEDDFSTSIDQADTVKIRYHLTPTLHFLEVDTLQSNCFSSEID